MLKQGKSPDEVFSYMKKEYGGKLGTDGEKWMADQLGIRYIP